jgi:uncharacterized protein (TIRG00374 family)
LPLGDSLVVFLAGFSLTMTPGKVGEVLKSYLLRETHGVPMARTAPTVVAERATDLIALLALAIGGASALAGARAFLWAAGALIVTFLIVASWRGLVHRMLDAAARMGRLGRAVPKLREFYDATWELMRPVPLAAAVALSLVAWAAECVAFWLVLGGFGAHPPVTLASFIYAAMTIAGALSFLPGGIGVQEAGMIELCVRTAGLGRAAATAATVVVRVCTLWFAIAIGVVCLLIVRRRVGLKLDALPAGEEAVAK